MGKSTHFSGQKYNFITEKNDTAKKFLVDMFVSNKQRKRLTLKF